MSAASKPAQRRVILSTSGGKDSSYTLLQLRSGKGGPCAVVGAVSTASEAFGRTSTHGTRKELVEAQCAAMGVPLATVNIAASPTTGTSETSPATATTTTVDSYMRQFVEGAVTLAAHDQVRASHVAFGDLFLADLRHTREEALQRWGAAPGGSKAPLLEPMFPLWFGREEDSAAVRTARSQQLARAIIDSGIVAVVIAVDATLFDDPSGTGGAAGSPKSRSGWGPPGGGTAGPECLLGRVYDEELLRDLPPWADPCGENGEFQTFVVDGPDALFPFPRRLVDDESDEHDAKDAGDAGGGRAGGGRALPAGVVDGAVPVRLGERVRRGDTWYVDVTLFDPSSHEDPASPLRRPADMTTVPRTVFISASKLVHTYKDDDRAEVMDDAVFFFGSKRAWVFPETPEERRESLRQPTRYLEFPEEFKQLILAKERQGLVAWLKPECSYKRVSKFFEGLGYRPLCLDKAFWCETFDARRDGQFVRSGEAVWRNIALGEHDYGATMELVYQSNPELLRPVL